MQWKIRATPQVKVWLRALAKTDPAAAASCHAAVDELASRGPALGRPLVDTVSGSEYPNMKELRPRSGQTLSIRILFAFDPKRQCLLLVAGNKAGNWSDWYRTAIPEADREFTAWLKLMEED